MRALIENADNVRPHGVGETMILQEEWWTLWVQLDPVGTTTIAIFAGGPLGMKQERVDEEEYPYFVPTAARALPLARRRLVQYVVEHRGGSTQDLAYAKNRVQQAELELFPNHFIS